MKRLRFCVMFCLSPLLLGEDAPPKIPKRIVTTEDLRQLLLATKWSWRNVAADVPDRECVFMADGAFRHPNFVANFIITDSHTVELHAHRKNGKSVMTFDSTYMSFEAIDFEHRRITGKRL
jgi:hypothetical protein